MGHGIDESCIQCPTKTSNDLRMNLQLYVVALTIRWALSSLWIYCNVVTSQRVWIIGKARIGRLS